MSDDKSRRWRAVLRTALMWGAAWTVAGGTLIALVTLFDPTPEVESLPGRFAVAVLSGAMWGVRFGLIGAVMGTLFSTVVRLGYRGRRLADISPVRFGLLGAVVGGVGVPLFLQTMNVLSGTGPIAWGLVTDDGVWASLFGGAAAAGSILLARRAEARSPAVSGSEELDAVDDRDSLPPAAQRPAPIAQGSRAAPY